MKTGQLIGLGIFVYIAYYLLTKEPDNYGFISDDTETSGKVADSGTWVWNPFYQGTRGR